MVGINESSITKLRGNIDNVRVRILGKAAECLHRDRTLTPTSFGNSLGCHVKIVNTRHFQPTTATRETSSIAVEQIVLILYIY